MEAVCSYETLVSTYEPKRSHNPEQQYLHLRLLENLKPHLLACFLSSIRKFLLWIKFDLYLFHHLQTALSERLSVFICRTEQSHTHVSFVRNNTQANHTNHQNFPPTSSISNKYKSLATVTPEFFYHITICSFPIRRHICSQSNQLKTAVCKLFVSLRGPVSINVNGR
jgi:hypothetical protein